MSMRDAITVSICGLEVFGRHGVLPEETRLGQRFAVDVDASMRTCPGIVSDDIADTLDYAALAARVDQIVAGEPSKLLEHLAGRIADAVLADERVAAVTVTVHKPHVALPQQVAETRVQLTRVRP